MNLSQLKDLYIVDRPLKPPSIRGIEVAFRSLESFLGKDTQVENIKLEQVIEWRHEMGKKVKAITYNSYLTQILAVFRFAKEKGFCDHHHPVLNLRKARLEKASPTIVKDEFFIAARNFLTRRAEPSEQGLFEPRWFWWCVILMLSYTGMRRRQLVELIWQDINWGKNTISLRKESSKNGKAWEIPITPPVLEVLQHMREKTSHYRTPNPLNRPEYQGG